MTSPYTENFTTCQMKIANMQTALAELKDFLDNVNRAENIKHENLMEEARAELIDEDRAKMNKRAKKKMHRKIIEQKKKEIYR